MKTFAKECVQYPFNPIALARTAIIKESLFCIATTLSITLSVNGTLEMLANANASVIAIASAQCKQNLTVK